MPSSMMRGATTLMTLSLLASAQTAAQSLGDFHFGRWGGSLETGYGTDRQQVRSPDSPTIDSVRNRTQERLTVRNEGFFYIDPGFVSGNLALSFGRLQEREKTDGIENRRQASLAGYAFDASVLSGLPYNGTLYANRNQNFLTQPFGRSDLTLENRGLVLRLREDSPLRDWGFPFFSASLRAEQQRTREDTTSVLGQSFRRDELRNTLSLAGHKGFETSDLDLRYELNDVSNSAFENANFRSRTANLNYSLDFGGSLNRRSDTRIFYYTRSGSSPFSLFSADERLRIDHQQHLSTSYGYSLTRTETQESATTTQSGSFDLRYKPYRDLATNVQALARRQQLPAGTRDSQSGQLALQYHRNLEKSGAVFGRLGARYQLDDNRLAASQINVTDEAQSAPSPLGAGAGFPLEQPFVIASSIVVVDTRGGARLATTPGVDYEIVPEGNLTRIVPLPTSAVIQAGDPLAISYVYEIDPTAKYGTTTVSMSGGMDLRWIAFSFAHERSDQKLLSGQDNRFLQDLRRNTVQLDLRGEWETLRAQAGAAYVAYDSTRLAYTQQRYTQLASYRFTRGLTLGFNADQTLTRYTLPERDTRAFSARLTLDWHAPWGLAMTALIGRRTYEDSLQPAETINDATLRARYSYGKLDLSSTFTANERVRGGFQTANWRLEFLAIRRF